MNQDLPGPQTPRSKLITTSYALLGARISFTLAEYGSTQYREAKLLCQQRYEDFKSTCRGAYSDWAGIFGTFDLDDSYAMVRTERARQVAQGYDAGHDDQHTAGDFVQLILRFVAPAITFSGDLVNAARFRATMVQVAAIAIAAIEWSWRLDSQRAARMKALSEISRTGTPPDPLPGTPECALCDFTAQWQITRRGFDGDSTYSCSNHLGDLMPIDQYAVVIATGLPHE